jgi:hypothetical protein
MTLDGTGMDLRSDEDLGVQVTVGRSQPSRLLRSCPSAPVWAGWLVGGIAISSAYDIATGSTTAWYYALFWFGMVVATLPTVVYVATPVRQRTHRLAVVVGWAAFSFVPKVLLDPSRPSLHDEYGHWREVADILRTNHLHQPNSIVPIIADFPGLHSLTAAVVRLSGLSIWHAALLILFIVHCAAMLAIFLIAERLGGSARAAGLAALIYALNSSFLYFDTQFAYESLAIPLLLVAVFCHVSLWRSRSVANVWRWTVMGSLVGMACVVTHHLSSFVLVVLLLLGAAWARSGSDDPRVRRHAARAAWTMAVAVAGFLGLWIGVLAPGSISYLSPYITEGARQLEHLVFGGGGNQPLSGSRKLFGHNSGPFYEHLAALAAPAVIFVFAVLGVRRLRREKVLRHNAVAYFAFGLLYFVSLPFTLVYAGAEGAHRSWAFTYIGLSLLLAATAVWLLDLGSTWASRRPAHRRQRVLHSRRSSHRLQVAMVAAFVVVLVGNVAAGENVDYRFPGPYEFGSDTRSVTPELLAISSYMKTTYGVGTRVVTDRYTGLVIGGLGEQDTAVPSREFPIYQLYFNAGPPSPQLRADLTHGGFSLMVVDKRDAVLKPLLGVFFEPDEPYAYATVSPITPEKLSRYNSAPWTDKVFESDNYAIYRFDLAAFEDPLARSSQ